MVPTQGNLPDRSACWNVTVCCGYEAGVLGRPIDLDQRKVGLRTGFEYGRPGRFPVSAAGHSHRFCTSGICELVSIPDSPVFAIRSFYFANAYLRVEGSGVTSFRGNGSGTVNCQYYDFDAGALPQWAPGNSEVFYISGI